MDNSQIAIRDKQRSVWNQFSAGWKKWNDINMVFLKPMADEMIRLLAPLGNESVLDVAAGTGEPGLTIAEMIPGGKVTITDLAEDMLAVANEMAAQRNIRNIETVACDVSAMPLDRKSTRLNSSHVSESRMPSSA